MCTPQPSIDTSAQVQAQQDAAETRAAEAARQQRILQGRDQINRMFDGGEVRQDTTVDNPEWLAWNAKRDALRAQAAGDPPKYETVFVPDEAGGFNESRLVSGTAGPDMSSLGPEPARTIAGSRWVKTGDGFDDAFYDSRRQAVLDYYTPEVNRQFGDARRGLSYALSRAGLTSSTEAGRRQGELARRYGEAMGDVARRAEGAVTDARTQVENQRATLLSQLEATGDQSGAANAALARTTTLRSSPVEYSPLGDLFGGVAQTIGSAVQGWRANQMSQLLAPYLRVGAAGSGSERVIGR